MKTMTCSQLGGACELGLSGADAHEIIQAQDRHLREVVAAGDADHAPGLPDMKSRWRRPLPGIEVVLAGDVCYERPMAERVTAWLREVAATGTLVLLGDPGRAYFPGNGVEKLATHTVPTPLELEDREARETAIWRLLPDA